MAINMSSLISRPTPLFASAALLRVGMLLYGLWQDANSPVKYTDIDYLVFTDAARFTFTSSTAPASPYERETYRYTPLLAWLLYPTTFPGAFCFSLGKVLFAAADLLAGYLIIRTLQSHMHMPLERACRFASIWLLNPMVATISTRGSSEGLLGVLVTALLWAVMERRVVLSGVLLGLGVHFKIYPFIYAPAVVWWMDSEHMTPMTTNPAADENKSKEIAKGDVTDGGKSEQQRPSTFLKRITAFVTPERIQLVLTSLVTFAGLNLIMYAIYGMPFVTHTYLHHVTRIDHRHNFSPYNVLLYLTSSSSSSPPTELVSPAPHHAWAIKIESIAFAPQLLLSTILIPLIGAKKDLATTMMAQTFAFVTFNKVCTSQYFLWYIVFLPLYLPNSSLLRKPALGVIALGLWVLAQGLWLQQGYNLEFLGLSTFLPGLWLSSLIFFAVNCFILGIIIDDL
ncbi:glycosyltransferase family 50 protein [Xylaria bambusicola]|uniref:glycosyltransferase family 50 protein n=1 Tax=Xylaria bambusicola TaxID=326684 RepID=UPI002007ECBE|nr:glycosyltransferase family 50 protein [Xylaria bambusicola]KAI0517105.1 glycosyltransferase family 50 protein [Xylaria bambusicola]